MLKMKKKVDKSLSDLLFKLTEFEKYGFVEIPEDWEVLENNTGEVVCSCGEFVETTYFPCAFDKDNNEVYYIGICPICGDFIYVCNCCPKEYRQSDEWKNEDLAKKLSMALRYSNIDDFIDYLIDREE